MSDRHAYDDQDVLDTLGDLDVEVEAESDDYDVTRDREATRDRSLWYPDADRSLSMRTQGYYPEKYPVGAVVHFTAGRSERGDRDAEATVKGGIEKGYCYFCISSTGKIYQTAPLHRWGSHAGKSSYPGLGSSLSRHLVGIEICNAGRLKKTSAGFEPYWNEYYDDGDPRRTIYTNDEVRIVTEGDNILDDGVFHSYTQAQEASLINLLLWLRGQKPQLFQLKYVLGHDEISPRRKNDPGGALSKTMPKFRAYLEQLERDGHTSVPFPKPMVTPPAQPEPVQQPPAAEQPSSVAQPEPVVQPAPIPGSELPAAPIEQTEPVPVAAVEPRPQPDVASVSIAASEPPGEVPVSNVSPEETASVNAIPAAVAMGGAALSAGATASTAGDGPSAGGDVQASTEAAATASAPVPKPAAVSPAPPVVASVQASDGVRGNAPDLKIGPEFLALLKTYRSLDVEYPHLKDVTFSQWALESGYGTSELAVRYKNFAGMKWRNDMSLYAQKVFYKPGHDPKDTAYCGFDTLENFIRGYWHRFDIRSLPYATANGGWRRHVESADAFIGFIGPIWAPSGGDNSLLNVGYVRKVRDVLQRLEVSGLLPSQAPASRSSGPVLRTPSPEARTIIAKRYAQANSFATPLSDAKVAQTHLVREMADCAARRDLDGVSSALATLYAHLEAHDSSLGAEDIRRLVGTLVASNAIRRNETADGNIHQLIAKIEAASKLMPPGLIEINQAAEQIYGELGGIPRVVPERAVETLVESLRTAGAFDWLARIADRLIGAGNAQLIVRRYYAQAMVEQGNINAAIAVLEAMLVERSLPREHWAEIHGQLGRAYSQIYVNHVRSTAEAYAAGEVFANNLRSAIKHYSAAYDPAKPEVNAWHGVRLAAMLKRAEADGIQLPGAGAAEDIAYGIIRKLEPALHQESEPWDLATVAECYLVLGDDQNAEAWYRAFATSPRLSYFKLAGAVRVLEEVWRLTQSDDPNGRSLMALKAASAKERVSQFSVTVEERRQIRSADFESTYPNGDFLPYRLLRQIVRAGECVAWIKDRNMIGVGSGFLIRGRDLAPSLGNELFLLTNTHVICDPELAKGNRPPSALTPGEARIQFEAASGQGEVKTYLLEARAEWQSPASECDACLLRFKEAPEQVIPARLASIEHNITAGDFEDLDDGTPVAVLGHANGEYMQLGIRGTLVNHQGSVVDIGPRSRSEKQPVYLHYDAPTMPGNSGSPVYDTTTWQVIGLHHAGFDAFEGRPRLYGRAGFHNANEGIYIHSIGMAYERERKARPRFSLFKRKG